MPHIILLACCKTKKRFRCPAQELYQGDGFQKALQYAKRLSPKRILILSAKHGVVSLRQELSPYEQTLIGAPAEDRKRWTEKVWKQLGTFCNPERDRFTILAGRPYYQYLLPRLGRRATLPLAHLGQGKRLAWLKAKLAHG